MRGRGGEEGFINGGRMEEGLLNSVLVLRGPVNLHQQISGPERDVVSGGAGPPTIGKRKVPVDRNTATETQTLNRAGRVGKPAGNPQELRDPAPT